jgi:hypothetical protein
VQHVRGPVLAGVLAGVVALTGACSGPDPSSAPSPPVASASAAPPSAEPSASDAGPSSSSSPSSGSVTPEPGPSSQATSGAPEPEPSIEPDRPVETAPPKTLDQPTRTAGAVVSLVSVRSTTVEARNPGERSGPGVVVRLRLRNAGSSTLDTSFVQVGVTDETGTAAIFVDGPPSERVASSVRAGRTVEGRYAFVTDGRSTDVVTVSVYVTQDQPVVTFRGRPR